MKIIREVTASWQKASTLPTEIQKRLLQQYINRYTGEHKPAWVRSAESQGVIYPLQFKDDRDWLEHTEVAITSKGQLDARHRACRSTPTWPRGDTFGSELQPSDIK